MEKFRGREVPSTEGTKSGPQGSGSNREESRSRERKMQQMEDRREISAQIASSQLELSDLHLREQDEGVTKFLIKNFTSTIALKNIDKPPFIDTEENLTRKDLEKKLVEWAADDPERLKALHETMGLLKLERSKQMPRQDQNKINEIIKNRYKKGTSVTFNSSTGDIIVSTNVGKVRCYKTAINFKEGSIEPIEMYRDIDAKEKAGETLPSSEMHRFHLEVAKKYKCLFINFDSISTTPEFINPEQDNSISLAKIEEKEVASKDKGINPSSEPFNLALVKQPYIDNPDATKITKIYGAKRFEWTTYKKGENGFLGLLSASNISGTLFLTEHSKDILGNKEIKAIRFGKFPTLRIEIIIGDVEPSLSIIREIPSEGDETQRQESDEQVPLHYKLGSGWQGSSEQGLEGLVDAIIKYKLISRFEDRDELYQAIYAFHKANFPVQLPSDKALHFDEQFVEKIQCPEGVIRKPTSSKAYIVFSHTKEHVRAENDGYMYYSRVVLHIDQNKFKEKLPELVNKIMQLPYVGFIKVAKNIYEASRLLDNFIIAFHDPPGSSNRSDLKQHLRPYEKDTLDGHPAMLKPLDDHVQGIALVEHVGGESLGGESPGETRCKAIERAIWILKKRNAKITSETLLRESKEQFREKWIDPNNPSKMLHEAV